LRESREGEADRRYCCCFNGSETRAQSRVRPLVPKRIASEAAIVGASMSEAQVRMSKGSTVAIIQLLYSCGCPVLLYNLAFYTKSASFYTKYFIPTKIAGLHL